MSLEILSYKALERHHEQARQATDHAIVTDNTDAYQAAVGLSYRVQREKTRRAIARVEQ